MIETQHLKNATNADFDAVAALSGTKALKMSDLHHLSEDQTKWNKFFNAEKKKHIFSKVKFIYIIYIKLRTEKFQVKPFQL